MYLYLYFWTIVKSKWCFENVLSAMSVPGCCFTPWKLGSQFQFIFVTIHICICHNSNSYLSKFIFVFVTIPINICNNSYLYLSQFLFIFVTIHLCIWHNFNKYLSKFIFAFVTIPIRICHPRSRQNHHHRSIRLFTFHQLCLHRKLHTLELDYYQHWYYAGGTFTVPGKYHQRR